MALYRVDHCLIKNLQNCECTNLADFALPTFYDHTYQFIYLSVKAVLQSFKEVLKLLKRIVLTGSNKFPRLNWRKYQFGPKKYKLLKQCIKILPLPIALSVT